MTSGRLRAVSRMVGRVHVMTMLAACSATLLAVTIGAARFASPASAGVAGTRVASRVTVAATHCHAVPQPAPRTGEYSAGSATSTNDMWLVGLRNVTGKGFYTLAEHWNGNSWRLVQTPNPEGKHRRVVTDQLSGVAALSSGRAWAIGSSSSGDFLLQWNGRSWSLDRSLPRHAVLGAISAVGSDVWIAGATDGGVTARASVFEWSGTGWHKMTLPVSGRLSSVAAVSSSNVWVSGLHYTPSHPPKEIAAHWNGNRWQVLPAAPEPANHRRYTQLQIFTLGPSDDDGVWAGGNWNSDPRYAGNPLLERWDGSRWHIASLPQTDYTLVSSVQEVSPSDVWVAASKVSWDLPLPPRGYLEHWNGSAWTRIAIPRERPYASLAAIVPVPGDDLRLIGWTGRRPNNSKGDPSQAVMTPMVDALTCSS